MIRVLLRSFALLGLAATLGCGSGGKGATATVSGTVLLPGGKPLPGGHIDFHSTTDAKQVASAVINEDGTYQVVDVPRGECRVTIDNAQLRKAPRMAGAENMPGNRTLGKYVRISPKYANVESSGLSTTVASRKETYNIELK